MHRRNNSEISFFTVESLAQIFDDDEEHNPISLHRQEDNRREEQQLIQTFQSCSQQCHQRRLSVSPYYQEIPLSIQKIHHDKSGDGDEESLISPLGDNESVDNESVFHFDENTRQLPRHQNRTKQKSRMHDKHKSSSSLLDDWSDANKVIIAKDLVLPPEPNGTYMPKSKVFKESLTKEDKNSIALEGWVRRRDVLK